VPVVCAANPRARIALTHGEQGTSAFR